METNWHVLQIANSHFRYTICCMIFEKKYHEVRVFGGGACMHQKSQQAIAIYAKKNVH